MVFTQGQQKDILEITRQSFKELLVDKDFLEIMAEKLSQIVITKLEDKIDKLMDKFNDINTKVVRLQEENEELHNSLDNLEQYTRRNSVRIFGIKEDQNENVDKSVINIFNNKMGLNITEEHIDRCHRVGKLQPNKSRAVIVKFASYRYRAMVFNSKKKLKGSKILIREDLTRARLDVLNNAGEKFGYKNTWSRDGVIIVNKNNKRCSVKSMAELEKLCKGD